MTDERNITESVFRKKNNLVGVLKKQEKNKTWLMFVTMFLICVFNGITYFILCFKNGTGCPFFDNFK